MKMMRMVFLSLDDLDESINLSTEHLGFAVNCRDGSHLGPLAGGGSQWHWARRPIFSLQVRSWTA